MNDSATQPRSGNAIQSDKVASRRSEMRDRLLATGAQLFAARGLAQVSVEELLEAAGISRATFYGFFANKSELAAAVMLPVFDSGIAALARQHARDPLAQAEQLIDMYLELWGEHHEALMLINMIDATVFPLIRQPHNEFGVAIRAKLQAIANADLLRIKDVDLAYRVLAKTGVPMLRLCHVLPEFETVYRDSMLGLLLKN